MEESEEEGAKTGPKKTILTDLTTFLNNLQDKEHNLVLLLDTDEDTQEEEPFNFFIFEYDIVYVYKELHSNSHTVTYLCSQKRLSYMFITPGLLQALAAIGYLLFHT
eukprot:170793-Ditylum_brightwellii.AAC.1